MSLYAAPIWESRKKRRPNNPQGIDERAIQCKNSGLRRNTGAALFSYVINLAVNRQSLEHVAEIAAKLVARIQRREPKRTLDEPQY